MSVLTLKIVLIILIIEEKGCGAEEERRKSVNRKRTLPVLVKLPVKLSCSSDLLGSKSGIDPPVAYQPQNAEAVYLLASSL